MTNVVTGRFMTAEDLSTKRTIADLNSSSSIFSFGDILGFIDGDKELSSISEDKALFYANAINNILEHLTEEYGEQVAMMVFAMISKRLDAHIDTLQNKEYQ